VAPVRPLRLKSERVAKPTGVIASEFNCAEVIVDSGVYHLDKSFSYLVPEAFTETCEIGTRVQVPFNGREVEGLVLRRVNAETTAGLKAISKVLTSFPVASEESINLILAVAQHWSAHPYDIIRSAIPPRVASVDKKIWQFLPTKVSTAKNTCEYFQFPPFENPYQVLARYVNGRGVRGTTLIVVPDSRAVRRLFSIFPEAVLLDSDLERTVRYENYLRAKYSAGNIVIGTRSAIFADIADLAEIIVVDEGSENYYEPRTPGWNVRDVSLIRSKMSRVPLVFCGFSPSVEVGLMLEQGEISYKSSEARVAVTSFQPENGELLPGRVIKEVKTALNHGPVLIIAPRKGYAQGVLCSKCRNLALCTCGGRFIKNSESAPLECSICAERNPDWACSWCQSKTQFLISRGSTRFAHEIGKAITGIPIASSEGDHILDDGAVKSGIVIATPGSAPFVIGGYSAILFLEAESLLSQADMRAQERARQIFFSHSGLVSKSGKVFLVISHGHPIIGALSIWKPSLLLQRDLRDREETSLPPYMAAIAMDCEVADSASFVKGLEQSRKDGRIPEMSRILGPSELKNGLHRVLILAPRESSALLTDFIHEFQRRRSAGGKSPVSMRIDPYSLSR
jgi:primosomal protein N' (replication factor Y)